MRFDSINKKLLNLVQVEFPLRPRPYSELGLRLGIDTNEVIQRLQQLKAEGIIRQISPVLDARSLGYRSTLIAVMVAERQLDRAARFIIRHPGVSHAYERDHRFNLWCTLTVPAITDMESEIKQLASPIEAEAIFALPAIKLFKIGVYFAMGRGGQTAGGNVAEPSTDLPRALKLSQTDRLIINEFQQDLPLTLSPFAAIAARLGMDEESFLRGCQSLLQRGVMRRFGAAINHYGAGFKANAMVCWAAPSDKVDGAGQELASLRQVSHCYERKTNPLWRYNLFAMIHSHTRESCQAIADKVSHETGLADYVLLYSTREFKKIRIKYLV